MTKYICGQKVVREFLASTPDQILEIFAERADQETIAAIKRLQLQIKMVSRRELDAMTNGANHQGIAAVMISVQPMTLDEIIALAPKKKDTLLVMLDGIEDPHNFGAILRTCEAGGVDAVIVKKRGQAPITPTVVRASAGAAARVRICEVTNLVRTTETLKRAGIWVVGAAGESDTPYDRIDYHIPVLLVFGNEDKGISHLLLQQCDFKASIPMKGKIESLNVSVAAGVMIYGVIKNRDEQH